MNPATTKVLLIGWDAADWKVINPLMDAGGMPNLRRLVETGVIGNMATLEPPLSPMLWTSIATGKRAYKHGIHGFTEVDPHTGRVRPVTNLGRKTKAVWNILNQAGKRCHVVGWWPSHPAEPLNGVMVSNHYHRAEAPLGEPWPLAPGTVHPERLREPLAALRVHPQELTHEHIGPFVPRWREVDLENDPRLNGLGRVLADCVSIQAAATAIMQLEPWDFMGVYFDAIDHFSHSFMRYHPPRNEWVPERDYELYREVVTGAYRFHDLMLGTLLGLAGEDTTVILMSDHGFHPDHQRLREVPHEPAGPAAGHRPHGILAARGPGLRRDERVYGASLLDVTPTILHLFGLPTGQDMDGHPLVTLFESPREVQTIPSWDAVPGEDGSHPPGRKVDTSVGGEAIKQLVALGYIAEPSADAARAAEETTRELRYNLARAHMGGDQYQQAIPLLEQLRAASPAEHRFGIQLAQCLKATGRTGELKELVGTIIARREAEAEQGKAGLLAFPGTAGEDPAKWTPEQAAEHRRLRRQSEPNFAALEYLRGFAEAGLGNSLAALERFELAGRLGAKDPGLQTRIGEVYLRLNQVAEARAAFAKALAIDAELAPARLGLCRCHLRLGENFEAANEALAATGLVYFNPYAHFLLGVALARFGAWAEARDALQVALAQNPAFAAAHRMLARLYGRRLGDVESAAKHLARAREILALRKEARAKGGPAMPVATSATPADFSATPLNLAPRCALASGSDAGKLITIVSGLPRSGTSVMMQMLVAGGLPALTDNRRAPDEDNPQGYLELEQATRLQADASFLDEAGGKCVKIVCALLPWLPADRPYAVILMERPMGEIMASQARMLERKGVAGGEADRALLARTFHGQMEQARQGLRERGIPCLSIPYHECLRNPEAVAGALQLFLGLNLELAAMTSAVNPALHRNR